MRLIGSLIALVLSLALPQTADALVRAGRAGNNIPVLGTPAIRCVLAGTVNGVAAGNCTGVGGGTTLFTAATCNGVADDAAAITSANNFIVGTWQLAHSGLVEFDIQSGKTCQFGGVDVNHNLIAAGILSFQMDGGGSTLADFAGTGGGFFLGTGSASGVRAATPGGGARTTARLATVAAGSSNISLLNTSQCGLFNNGDPALIAGIDPEGFGDPPSPGVFEWVTISSTASCAGTGAITLTAGLAHGYKSTWPLYNPGNDFNSDQGGPATLYQLGGGSPTWAATHAYFNLVIDQQGAQTNVIGKDITLVNVSCPGGFCVIPSQNKFYREYNVAAPNSNSEFDKIISNLVQQNITRRQIKIQQRSPYESWSCTDCTINNSLLGTPGPTTFVRGTIAELQLGTSEYGGAGSFFATNTTISAGFINSVRVTKIESRGSWSSTGFTVPQNIEVLSASSCGTTCTQFLIDPSTTAIAWFTGMSVGFQGTAGSCGDIYAGEQTITAVDATHVRIAAAFSATCAGPIGNLPLAWAIPGLNVYFTAGVGPLGPVLQVTDLSTDANNSTIVTFNQSGSPYSGGLPTLPGTTWAIAVHPAPAWSCVGCTGSQFALDANSPSASGLPFGSYISRTVTAANSSGPFMLSFGALTELDETVTVACGGASNLVFFQGPAFTQVLGSSSLGSFGTTVNAQTGSGTPRVTTQTTSSGGQAGDTLTPPGVGTWIVTGQVSPQYTNTGNCPSASTTFTIKTDQGVVP